MSTHIYGVIAENGKMPTRVDCVTAGRGCAILNVDSGVWEEKAEGGVLDWFRGTSAWEVERT